MDRASVSVSVAEVLTILTILHQYRQHFRSRIDNIDIDDVEVRAVAPPEVHIAVATPATRADIGRSMGNRATREPPSGAEQLCNRPCQFCIV